MPGRERRDGGRSADDNQNKNERRGGRRDDRRNQQQDERSQYIERVVTINRVSKVVKGGRRFSFTALVIVGDGDGMVGVGYGKAKEVPAAISKGVEEAKKNFFRVPRVEKRTIPHRVQGEAAAGVVMLPLASSAPTPLRQLDLYLVWDPQRTSPVRERLLAQLRLCATQ